MVVFSKQRISMRSLNIVFVFIFSFLVTACGSGGSSHGNSSGTASSTAITHSLSGTAVKGVLKNATVEVYRLANGNAAELLASGQTDADGHFNLTVQSDPTDVLVVVKAAKDGSSRMLCDALAGCGSAAATPDGDSNKNGTVDFGEWGSFPANLQLRSVVNAGTNTSLTTQVSPLTELATAFASSFPQGMDSLSFQVAASQASNLFGLNVNLTSLSPLNIANQASLSSADQNAVLYSLINAALYDVANGADFETFFSQLANTFIAQQGQLVGHASDNSVTLQKVFDKALALALKLNLTNAYTQLASLKAKYLALNEGELSNAIASPTSGNDKLTKAKQLVSDIDHWNSYFDLGASTVQATPEADLIGTELAPETQKMLRSLGVAAQFGVLGAVPTLAINNYCGQQVGVLSLLCFTLAKNITESCAAVLSAQPNSQLICMALNNIPIPASLNLVVIYHLLDKNVEIKGNLKDYDVALKISIGQIQSQDVTLTFNGTMKLKENTLTISNGTVVLHFPEVIDLNKLKLPSTAHLTFDGVYTATSTEYAAVNFNGHYDSNIDLTQLNQSGTAFNNLDTKSLSVLASLPFDMTVTGKTSTSAGLLFDASITTVTGSADQITLSYKDASDVQYTQFGPAAFFTHNLPNLRVEQNGAKISLQRNAADSNQITLSNQDNVVLTLNLATLDGGKAGSLTVQGQTYGTVTRKGNQFIVHFGDLSTYSLQSAGN